MNIEAYHKSGIVRHFILAFFIGLFSLAISYAGDLPERITELTLAIDQDSVRISPISPSKAKIMGRVKEARWAGYDTYETEDRSRTIYYDRYGKQISPNDRFFRKNPNMFKRFISYTEHPKITKKGSTRWGSYNPPKISMRIPYRSTESEADVLSDGQFSGYLELRDGYYFSKDPDVNMKPGYSWWKTEREIVFLPENPKNPGSFGNSDNGDKHKITLYFIDVKSSLANGLLTKGLLTNVRIEFAEKNSRVPVKPDVKIIIEDGPTFGLIKAKWEKEYDATVVNKLEEAYHKMLKRKGVIRVLEKGDIEEVRNKEAVEFWAFTGSSFKLETRDRNFYYFKGVFRADKEPITQKTVLLIEIGGKVRPDDEGHGGQIISD